VRHHGAARAIVTGANAGIGASTAVLLARRKADVWLTYAHDRVGADDVAAQCRSEGVEAHVSQLDLRDPDAIAALLGCVADVWGSVSILINNAATCPYTSAAAITTDEWDDVLETNARGTFLMLRGALPLLRASGGDRSIVNVSSVAGQIGGITTSVHYAASKAAVLAITRSYARLLAAEGIRVNAVTPGAITTRITAQLDDDTRARLATVTPLGRLGTPDEVAATIVLLASPESGYTTGATYDVNGGIRMD
jgi:3-oxoacyl-[acyl-carrier protein] reductase